MDDLISRQAAIDCTKELARWYWEIYHEKRPTAQSIIDMLNDLPSAQPEQRWIPIKWHNCTDEDREKYGFSNDIVAVFDCEMPDDDQPILVTTSHGYVNQDVCYIGEGFSLDSGWDWIDDIEAWMPLPKPYKEGQDEQT